DRLGHRFERRAHLGRRREVRRLRIAARKPTFAEEVGGGGDEEDAGEEGGRQQEGDGQLLLRSSAHRGRVVVLAWGGGPYGTPGEQLWLQYLSNGKGGALRAGAAAKKACRASRGGPARPATTSTGFLPGDSTCTNAGSSRF